MSDLSANPDPTPKFPEITPEFVLIPAGSFQMGDATDADQNAPVHSVYVDAFFFGKYLVTKALWDQCRNWAIHHGYPDLPEGEATAPSHPVQMISWYEMAKWINALSEQHHLTPAYYTNESHSTVYRTGDLDLRLEDVRLSPEKLRIYSGRRGCCPEGAPLWSARSTKNSLASWVKVSSTTRPSPSSVCM